MRTFSQYIYKKSIRTRAYKYPHPKLNQQKKRASYDNVRYTLGGGGDDGNGNGDSVDDSVNGDDDDDDDNSNRN